MEGRTIVRPVWLKQTRTPRSRRCLQWRAGQSSGQSRDLRRDPQRRSMPSMEGRTIVRPVSLAQGAAGNPPRSFNGGPDNRPASPGNRSRCRTAITVLQWRAGQSSGQSTTSWMWIPSNPSLQWRAGQSSGQSRQMSQRRVLDPFLQWRAGQSSGQSRRRRRRHRPVRRPSMEGRTIVRPVSKTKRLATRS